MADLWLDADLRKKREKGDALNLSLAEIQPGSKTVVVAEDENMLRMIAVEFLTEAGFIVIEAAHAKAALGILQSQYESIHVLFTDIHMPGEMNGLELAHHVKRSWPNIALLIASGDVWPKTEELPEGSRFLPKPYNYEHVVRHVRRLLAV